MENDYLKAKLLLAAPVQTMGSFCVGRIHIKSKVPQLNIHKVEMRYRVSEMALNHKRPKTRPCEKISATPPMRMARAPTATPCNNNSNGKVEVVQRRLLELCHLDIAFPVWPPSDKAVSPCQLLSDGETWDVPFTFYIPDSLPPSYDASNPHNLRGNRKKRYFQLLHALQVKIYLRDPSAIAKEAQAKPHKHGLKGIAYVVRLIEVAENLRDAAYDHMLPTKMLSREKGFLMNGTRHLSVSAATNKSVFAAREPVYVHVDINNETAKKVRGIRARFHQLIVWVDESFVLEERRQEGYKRHSARFLQDAETVPMRKIDDERSLMRLYGNLRKESVQKWQKFGGDDFCVPPRSTRTMILEVQSPPGAQSVVNSRIMRVHWILEIEVEVRFGRNLSVNLPVRFTHPTSSLSLFFQPLTTAFFQNSIREIDIVPSASAQHAPTPVATPSALSRKAPSAPPPSRTILHML
jgi:hypothetical protein